MRKLPWPASNRQLNIKNLLTTSITTSLFFLTSLVAGPLQAADDTVDAVSDTTSPRVTKLSQAATDTDQASEEEILLEEVVVTGTQIKGAAISEALAVTVMTEADIDATGVSSAAELLDMLPEQGQNFQTEAENSYNVNAVRGDVGAFNLRNMGTGNTLVLLNGRRMVQTAGYQTELVGGSYVPVNTVNSNEIPTMGIRRVEVLRDGASAIYGADAVAGVVNTVLQNNFEGLTVRARYDWYDNIPRNNIRVNIKWGNDFNDGRTNISLFADYYHRDRVNSQDDSKWADSDFRRFLDDDSPFLWDEDGDPITTFRNTYWDSGFGQYDAEERGLFGTKMDAPPWTDSGGEFEVFPSDHEMCQHEDAWMIPASNGSMCGLRDGVNRDEYGVATNYRYNANGAPYGRDLSSDLDRYNLFLYLNHEFENGTEAYTELSYYQADTNLVSRAVWTLSSVELYVGAQNYYNPFGPCDSPNRVPGLPENDVPCEGIPLKFDAYGWVEYPRIVNNTAKTWRFLQGFRGSWGDWDWDSALVWSEATRDDNTSNRISNTLMFEALNDPTPSAYNPYAQGHPNETEGTNIERALIDVYRKNETDLKMVDFKLSNPELFNLPAGPVGFLFGAEYREESFLDNRDPRLDGTIVYDHWDGQSYPYVSDVIGSSPSSDSSGGRDTMSAFFEFAIPVFKNFDLQAALRWEDASDFEDTTVGKLAFGWRIFEPLLIRGSWSEAFRAPNLVTVNEGLVVRSNGRTSYVCRYAEEMWEANRDPSDPDYEEARDELDCTDNVQRRAQGSESLVPEESTNTSIGLVWEPTENLMFTVDFWEIEKTDTIGLFGETNHSMLDALLHIENGMSNCGSFVGNPVMGYSDADPDQIQYYTEAGICPVGQWLYTNDSYANLDTRIVEGYDVGIFYSVDGNSGSWDLTLRGSFYEKYVQKAGPLTQQLIDAAESGVFPAGFPTPSGFGDLLKQNGNQTTKYNTSLRWRRDHFGAGVSAYYLGRFFHTGPGIRQGQKWTIPSMTRFNTYFDYYADLFNADTRFRFGINNFTNERAPLADRYYGYYADAHRDMGRYFYIDVRMGF
ncbi:MAG: TonB-dependent receptor [Gammaproteobacteria bacterium]|nr:TonB-dependent receptor [Gammaproteobacteria bacterium]